MPKIYIKKDGKSKGKGLKRESQHKRTIDGNTKIRFIGVYKK